MGTTVTGLLVSGAQRLRGPRGRQPLLPRSGGGSIYQISEDHSLVNEQLKAGAITVDEARNSRFKNIITRSVGFEPDVMVDSMGLELEPGDRLVVCSDGLSNLVDDDEILELARGRRARRRPRRLVALANERGGDDNITVVVVTVE